ncbi:MAG: hypothetical protein AB1505_15745 [Candidatus Latescibacterota bacterium]
MRRAGIALGLLIAGAGGAAAAPPQWSVNASAYELSAAVTAQVWVDYAATGATGDLLAAFSGEEGRGVAAPVQALGRWVYFVTVFANANGDTLSFRAYLADRDQAVEAEETVVFQANASLGSPAAPLLLNVILEYDSPPVVSGLPDQTVDNGGVFAAVDLDDYLESRDGDPVAWACAADNYYLTAQVGAGNRLTVATPGGTWAGAGTVTCTAVEQTAARLSGASAARYTVMRADRPAALYPIPNQTIGRGGTFAPVPLREQLSESDGDSVA